MTKIEKNNLQVNLAQAVFHRRRVTMGGKKIKGVMIGFIPEQPAGEMTVYWNITDRAITVSKQVVSEMINGRIKFR